MATPSERRGFCEPGTVDVNSRVLLRVLLPAALQGQRVVPGSQLRTLSLRELE